MRFDRSAPDLSELPSASRRPQAIEAQIAAFGLARIVDHVDPYGSIMAGDWNKPFSEARAAKRRASK
ncbi:hypothetical protein [Acuticoccus sp.]|uniref:hypothetical protein n=1 Tax=Acuticoccus sp. TaxID=1904378 RepID=UPI003B51E51A